MTPLMSPMFRWPTSLNEPMFHHYQFDHDALARAAETIAATLAETRPLENPAAFAAQVVAGRLRDAPGDYLQYGPYWWSVKQALRGAGHVFGDTDSVVLRAAYGAGLTAHQALVAGEQFRDYYRAQLMAGTATFALGAEDGADTGNYTLFDVDMETLRHGPVQGGLAVVDQAYQQVSREPDEPILDDVQVRFEEGGELWTAVVDGGLVASGMDPEKLVTELQHSGQIGRAIDVGKGLRGSPSADDAGYAITSEQQLHRMRIGYPRT